MPTPRSPGKSYTLCGLITLLLIGVAVLPAGTGTRRVHAQSPTPHYRFIDVRPGTIKVPLGADAAVVEGAEQCNYSEQTL